MFCRRARGSSRKERVHAIIAFQERHVGCLVALLHYVIGHGKDRLPSGSQPSEIITETAGAATQPRPERQIRDRGILSDEKRVAWLPTTHS